MKTAEAIMTEGTLARLAEEVETRERAVEDAKQHLADVEARQKAASVELAALEAAQAEVETALASGASDTETEERLRSTLAASAMGRARLSGLGRMKDSAQTAVDEAVASLTAAKAAHEERRQWEWRLAHLEALDKGAKESAEDIEEALTLAKEAGLRLGRVVLRRARAQHLREKCDPKDNTLYGTYSRFLGETDALLRNLAWKQRDRLAETTLRVPAYSEGLGVDLVVPLADASCLAGCGGHFGQSHPQPLLLASPEVVGF